MIDFTGNAVARRRHGEMAMHSIGNDADDSSAALWRGITGAERHHEERLIHAHRGAFSAVFTYEHRGIGAGRERRAVPPAIAPPNYI